MTVRFDSARCTARMRVMARGWRRPPRGAAATAPSGAATGIGHRLGFTLLEVLVVVAIIAVLISVLLVSLDKARQQSRRVLCQTRLAELTKAWHMYLRDSRDRFTARGLNQEYNYGGKQGEGAPEFGSNPALPILKPLNHPYCRINAVTRTGADLFACPADTGTNWIRPTAFGYYGTSYRMNHLLVGQPAVPALAGDPCQNLWKEINKRLSRLTASSLDSPSLLTLMGDYAWYECWDRQGPDDCPDWHGRKASHNLAFFDGHVGFVRVRKGIQVDSQYRLIPYSDLSATASGCQKELPCP